MTILNIPYGVNSAPVIQGAALLTVGMFKVRTDPLHLVKTEQFLRLRLLIDQSAPTAC